MRKWTWQFGTLALAIVLAVGYSAAQEKQATQAGKQAAAKGASRQADEEAIRKQARDFEQAFAKGDAKAIAAQWTENAVYRNESGEVVRGRAALEKEFADFFKEHPKCPIEVRIESITFLSRDSAMEDGILQLRHACSELPTSTRYTLLHVREDGQWHISMGSEAGATEDKLHDIDWLIGKWTAKSDDYEVSMSFDWNEKHSAIMGQHTTKEKGQFVSSGNQRIALDPLTGQLRSWVFADDGGHGTAFWSRDGNRWVLHATSVMSEGSGGSATNILTRVSNDEFLWRSVDRSVVLQGVPDSFPDTLPIKLTRVKGGK
jgi:uncharacterized protein (TIGR02246 family)